MRLSKADMDKLDPRGFFRSGSPKRHNRGCFECRRSVKQPIQYIFTWNLSVILPGYTDTFRFYPTCSDCVDQVWDRLKHVDTVQIFNVDDLKWPEWLVPILEKAGITLREVSS